MSTVGIIANPASGKDIRRLVAHGSVFDNQEKVNIMRRALAGLNVLGTKRVVYMPEYFGIVLQAIENLRLNLPVEPINISCLHKDKDSYNAATLMRDMGVSCIITLGGDGTNRMVAKGCGEVPLVPISTGTNNVFPGLVEGTVAGMAAALVAQNLVAPELSINRRPKLELRCSGREHELALIDAAIYEGSFTASRAIWDTEQISRLAVSWHTPTGIGLSSLAAYCWPQVSNLSECKALLLEMGKGGKSLMAPVAPGLVKRVHVKRVSLLHKDEDIVFADHSCVIALDGEREVEVGKNEVWTISYNPKGPFVVDIGATVQEAARMGLFGKL